MPTVNLFRPLDAWAFPFGNDRNFDGTPIKNDNQLLLQIIQIDRPEPYDDIDCHSGSDISTVLFRVVHSVYIKLFVTEWCYLYPLDVLGQVHQLNFRLISPVGLKVIKHDVLWYASEFDAPTIDKRGIATCGCELPGCAIYIQRLVVCDRRTKVPLILGKCYFTIHALYYLTVLYLLLNIQLG